MRRLLGGGVGMGDLSAPLTTLALSYVPPTPQPFLHANHYVIKLHSEYVYQSIENICSRII